MVFDMAGTTVNENNVVYKTLQRSINEQGLQLPLETVLTYGAGKEKKQAIIDILNHIQTGYAVEKLAGLIYVKFKSSLKLAYENLDVKAYEGVEKLFQYVRARGIKVVLNTGYDSATAETLLSRLNWKVRTDIDGLVTASMVKNGRPHPEMIHKAMGFFGITDPREVLKAGDSVVDIEEGKNAGCGITVGVLTGAQTEEELKKAAPDYIFDSLDKVLTIL